MTSDFRVGKGSTKAPKYLTYDVKGDEITLPGIKFKFKLFWNFPHRGDKENKTNP